MTPAGLESVRVDLDPPVATITLDRPRALNAITPQMLAELATAFEWAGREAAVVVLTGAGRAFSAGVDLKALGDRRLDGGMVGELLDRPARRVIDLIRGLDAIVLAKINGHCFTGARGHLHRAAGGRLGTGGPGLPACGPGHHGGRGGR